MIGLDVETTSLSPDEGELRLVQLSAGRGARVFDMFTEESDDAVAALLDHAEPFVAHNAVFERRWIKAKLNVDIGVIHDTMIMSQVLYGGTRAALRNKFSHSLASVVDRELKIEMSKEQQQSDWSAVKLTPEQLRYAAYDAYILPKLASKLLSRIDQAGLRDTYELELRVSHAIDAMQTYGVAVHTDRLDAMIEDATEEAVWLKDELAEEWAINPGSSKQLREYFDLDGRADWPQTPAGAPSTNQDAMRRLVDDYPEVKKWLKWKEVEKIRSTYGESLKKRLKDGRIHARFNPFGTATGRFSSSGPNLQNIPKRGAFGKRMRGLFWSGSDDRILIKADYVSIELWVAAVMWDDPYMKRELSRDTNMHVATAAQLFNTRVEDVTDEQKRTGKIVNFALLYGGSPRRILQEFEKNGIPITEQGAAAMHAKFYAGYKGFARRKADGWAKFREDEATGHHDARTAIGRRRTHADWVGPLLNHEIQGTAADGIKFALARMNEDPQPGVQPVLTVHDEIVVEAPAAGADDVAAWVEHHMVEGMLQGLAGHTAPSRPKVEIEFGREWS